MTSILAGKGGVYIMFRHILPNILAPVLTNALTQIGTTMIGLSGLSFLGLGVIPPTAEWGSMISEGRAYIQIAPWTVLFPALATIVTITLFNYLGDAVMEYRNV
jgi:peptide/nickel transport system permease protein